MTEWSAEKTERIELLKLNRCYWCGSKLTSDRTAWNFRTREHLIPKSLGGRNNVANVVWACVVCNQARGADMSWEPISPLEYEE